MEDNKKKLKIKVFTAFSGYDSQCMALDRLKEDYDWFDYELVGWSEIDEPAIRSHNAVYPQHADKNYGDISKINWEEVPDFDLFTYSSPCQSFSICGKQEGGEEGSGTRSSLLWECRKTIQMKRPKFCILENVKALVSNKFINLFERWIETVNSMGYVSKWTVLNAAKYDIPQGRERVFLVSVRKDSEYDKPEFYFPAPLPRTREVEDFFDQEAPEEYYLDDRDVPKFMDFLNNTGDHFVQTTEIHQEIAEVKIQEEAEKKKAEEENKIDPNEEVEGGLF